MKIASASLAALIVAGALSPSLASAACSQSDLGGTWWLYAIDSDGVWSRCKLTISGTGKFASTTCSYSSGIQRTLSSGSVKTAGATSCIFTGQFVVNGQAGTVTHATLARDKNTAQGVGAGSGAPFLFSMTKL